MTFRPTKNGLGWPLVLQTDNSLIAGVVVGPDQADGQEFSTVDQEDGSGAEVFFGDRLIACLSDFTSLMLDDIFNIGIAMHKAVGTKSLVRSVQDERITVNSRL